jgi:hypothetical protein
MKDINFSKITQDLLHQEASASSFIRGEDYYERGAVSKIKYNESTDSITAKVRGRNSYTVTIVDVSESPEFTCTCPAPYYLCKHSIAAALEIINSPDAVTIEKPKTTGPQEDTVKEVEKLIKKASTRQKENFLTSILKESDVYRDRFRTLVSGQLNVESRRSVEEIRDAVKHDFEQIDFSNTEQFYDNSYGNYGYRDEWDIVYEGAVDELNSTMEKFKSSIFSHLNSNNIVEATKELLGLYEGISLVDENEIDDPEEIFCNGIVPELLYFYFQFLEEYLELFRVVDRQENALLRISAILVERLKHYRDRDSSDEDFNYNLSLFKPFINELITTENIAQYWDTVLTKLALKNGSTDEVQLKIAELLEQETEWLKVAEKNFKHNPEITRRLLDFYLREGKGADFVRIGKYALDNWGDDFDQYLYKHLKKDENPEFYAKILAHYARHERSVSLFEEYKKHFGEAAARTFIDSVKKEQDEDLKKYYIRLLEIERDYTAILEYVKKHRDDYDFVFYINPILNVYPAECFSIIKQKADDFLAENTGRKYYYIAAQWLKLLLKIEDKTECKKIRQYFHSLFQVYNNRRALKDEFRKAGIDNFINK